MKIYVISMAMVGPDSIIAAFKSFEDADKYVQDHYAKSERVRIHETNLN